MDVKTYLMRQIAGMHDLVDAAFEGLTDEQLTWIPPGTANPIGLTALHLLSSEDHFIINPGLCKIPGPVLKEKTAWLI